MATTASCLARAFAIVVRQITDLLTMLQDYHALLPSLPRTLDVSYQDSIDLQVKIIAQNFLVFYVAKNIFLLISTLSVSALCGLPSQTNVGLVINGHGFHRSAITLRCSFDTLLRPQSSR